MPFESNDREERPLDGGVDSPDSMTEAGDLIYMPVETEAAVEEPPPEARAPGEVPPLPPDASPEEKELHWCRYVYQGEHIKQLSLRAVLMGGILGMFMSVSNLYTTLKLGWAFGVAITSCVLSFVIWNAIRALSGRRLTPMTILENNCMQSTASAAGMSTGGTIAVAFGAMLLITGHHTGWHVLVPYTFLTAALGVFLAIPMKRQMINIEQLKFPSGIVAAETLRSLHGHGAEALRKAYSLLAGLGSGAVVGLLRGPEGAVKTLDKLYHYIHIPELLPFSGPLNPLTRGSMTGLGFEPGTLMIAAGMFVGVRVSLSMLGSSIVLYYLVAPWLLAHDRAMADTADYVASFTLDAEGNFNPLRWALWGGTSIMLFSSLTAVATQWRTLVRAFTAFRKGGAETPDAIAHIEVPMSWLVVGLAPIGIGLILVNYLAFRMSILLGLIAVVMSSVISLVCCRATGETDTTPIGAMGKLTQLLYALLAHGNSVVNLMSAGVTAAAGGSAADLLTDLKSGYLLGANPRKQFLAQFAGVFFGVAAIVPAWYLMVPDKAALEAFHPPATNMWRAVAEALTQGLHTVPVTAQYAIVIGGLVGIALPLIATAFPKAAPFLPSAMGLGLAWVVPFQNSLSFAIGALIAWAWARAYKRHSEVYTFPIASGLVAGESIVLAMIAILATAVQLLGH
jgi:OPT family oligopeptide transporter